MSYLQHHGVLGMKWGVRKQRRQTIKQATRDAERITKLKKSNRIKAPYEKRALEKQVAARRADKEYDKAFREALKDIEIKATAGKIKKQNTIAIAKTVASVYANPMSLYREDPFTKMAHSATEQLQERQNRKDVADIVEKLVRGH